MREDRGRRIIAATTGRDGRYDNDRRKMVSWHHQQEEGNAATTLREGGRHKMRIEEDGVTWGGGHVAMGER